MIKSYELATHLNFEARYGSIVNEKKTACLEPFLMMKPCGITDGHLQCPEDAEGRL